MAEDKKHRVDAETYRKYLSGNMTPAERHAFERVLLNDPFAHEAMEGMESLAPEQIDDDLKALKTQLAQRTQKKEPAIFWRIAATVLLLGIFSFVIYYFIDNGAPTELAQEKPALSEKADTIAIIKPKTDSILTEKPDQVIAYQQPLDDEKATKSRVFREPENPQPYIVPEENNEITEALDYAAPAEADEILVEKAEGIVVQKPAAPSIMTEMKKAETSPAQESKSLSSKKRDLAGAAATVSQNHTIRGKVISADDDSPAPGVNVVVKGSSTGTITDIDGNYEISVPAVDEATLVFSYIGYTTEEVELKKEETVVDVSLYADVTSLSEVVVVGYSNSQEETPSYSFTPPKPSGGQSKFNDYIKANLRYPASGLSTEIKGSVKVQFTITATGAMTNIRVIRSLGEDFDKEALRLIQDGPRWESAEENGSKVARDVKVTIRFKPPE